jgi:hypothetical protein
VLCVTNCARRKRYAEADRVNKANAAKIADLNGRIAQLEGERRSLTDKAKSSLMAQVR